MKFGLMQKMCSALKRILRTCRMCFVLAKRMGEGSWRPLPISLFLWLTVSQDRFLKEVLKGAWKKYLKTLFLIKGLYPKYVKNTYNSIRTSNILIKKWGKNLKRHLTKDTGMTRKHRNRCSSKSLQCKLKAQQESILYLL